jgi:hypothetical protein
MAKFAAIVVLAGLALVLLTAPNAASPSERPSGRLVLSLVGHDRARGPVSGEWIAVVDVRTGKTIRRPLPGGTLCHGKVLVAGGRVIYGGSRHGRAAAESVGLDLKGRPRLVAYGAEYAPAAAADRLWLSYWRYGKRPSARLREATLSGQTVFRPPGRLPMGWMRIAGEFAGGLVVDGDGVGILDPHHGRWTKRMKGAWLTAVHPRRMAWCATERCRRLHVSDGHREIVVKSGRVRSFSAGGAGAFSPDGSLLATAVGGGERPRVAVVDPERRSVDLVPGARVGAYAAVAWSSDGRWLFFATPHGRVMAYRPGEQRAVPLPVRFGGDAVMSLAGA